MRLITSLERQEPPNPLGLKRFYFWTALVRLAQGLKTHSAARLEVLGQVLLTAGFLAVGAAVHAAGFPQDKSDLPADDRITFGQLENGLRYAILPHDEPPERVSLRLFVDAGSFMETEPQRGLAHFLEHMAFNGTKHFAAGEMIEYFQRLGMEFGADTNAHTAFDETVYKLELPNAEESILRDGMLLLSDWAGGMLLEPEEIEKEKGVIINEMVARDSIDYRILVARLKFLFPGTRIPERMPIGLARTVGGADRELLSDFYETWYDPERMAVIATGNVTTEGIEPLIAEYFGYLRAKGTPPDPDLGALPNAPLAAALRTEPEASETRISIQSLKPWNRPVDNRAYREADLILDAANAILSRRFQRLAREENAPFSRGFAYAYGLWEFADFASVDLVTQPEEWEQALTLAETELRRAIEYGFSQGELDEARANIINQFEQAVKTAPTRKARSLADGITSAISSNRVFTSPETDLEIARTALEGLELKEVQQALANAWAEGVVRIFVSGNLELESPAERILATYNASRAEPVEALEELDRIEFAYRSFGEPGRVAERRTRDELGITQIRFANYVRLNLKPTDFEADTIRIIARFGGGELEADPDRPGLPLLASETYIAGGLEAHTQDEIQRIFAGRNVGVGFTVDSDAFVLSGQTTPDDLADQLDLMAAYLTAPAFREEAERLARRGFEEMYVELEHTPGGVLRDEVSRFLAGDDFRFGFPAPEELATRTLPEVRQWLQNARANGYLEVSLVGDFDIKTAIGEVARTFGALPARERDKKRFPQMRQLDFPEPQSRTFTYASEVAKGVAAVHWKTVDMDDIREVRVLSVLADILSDRLRQRVREELGQAYSPYAYHNPSDVFEDYGHLTAMVVSEPETIAPVAGVIRSIAEDLHASGTSEDELGRALEPRLVQLKEYMRNNGYWLNTVLAKSQESPRRLDWARTIEEGYAGIGVEDIDRLARRYLDPDEAVEVFVDPLPAKQTAPTPPTAEGEE